MSGYTFRGRGHAFYSPRTSASPSGLPPDRNILDRLSETPLQTITKLSPLSSDREVTITNLRYVGSYNWLDKPTPTIIVPGSPRKWTNRAPPYQVHADDGISFKDQNGYRCPTAVLLPLITAVDRMSELDNEEFDWAAIDFVTDRNNLRKLLRWVSGTAPNDFRIDMQLAGKTVLLNRWENRYREQMSGRTFGFNFEKASTVAAPGCEGSTGHHRIVRYDLNGLKMVVRFEVDACIPSEAPAPPKSTATAVGSSSNIDDLIGALSGVTLRTEGSHPPLSPPASKGSDTFPKVTVIPGGSVVPQSSIVEMTTRSLFNAASFDWVESYSQLFFSQTPHHFLAIHERGRFREVKKRKLESAELKKLAADSIQANFKKLRRLLDVIRKIAIKHGERGRLSLVCQGAVRRRSCSSNDSKPRADGSSALRGIRADFCIGSNAAQTFRRAWSRSEQYLRKMQSDELRRGEPRRTPLSLMVRLPGGSLSLHSHMVANASGRPLPLVCEDITTSVTLPFAGYKLCGAR
ncbi:putative geranylgeranyl pyrophosphate synthetase [Lyophyllum shimeji]|uniref:Geranylgeranyl pyrophosphate synthetase n=1 Tax=Lyophyllum shimeji TaxID=47721 RepID=A0A9P3PNB2_LYOSH|nr:putative geranylgeranyl pyrophosphate synthetase [Lyophyllum shimeji]